MCDTGMLTILGRARLRRAAWDRDDQPSGDPNFRTEKLSSGNLAKLEPRSAHIVREPTATKEKYGLSSLKVANSCAKLADKFRTGRPSDVIQYGSNLSSYLVKVLAPNA